MHIADIEEDLNDDSQNNNESENKVNENGSNDKTIMNWPHYVTKLQSLPKLKFRQMLSVIKS